MRTSIFFALGYLVMALAIAGVMTSLGYGNNAPVVLVIAPVYGAVVGVNRHHRISREGKAIING